MVFVHQFNNGCFPNYPTSTCYLQTHRNTWQQLEKRLYSADVECAVVGKMAKLTFLDVVSAALFTSVVLWQGKLHQIVSHFTLSLSSLSLSLSVSLSVFCLLSVCLSVCLCLSVCSSISISFSLVLTNICYVSIYVSTHVCVMYIWWHDKRATDKRAPTKERRQKSDRHKSAIHRRAKGPINQRGLSRGLLRL